MIARVQEVLVMLVASNPVLERLAAASIDLVVVTALVAAIVALARIRSRRVIALLWLVALVKPIVSLAVGAPAPLIPIATLPQQAAPVETVEAPLVPAERNVEVTVTSAEGAVMVHEEREILAPAASATAGGTSPSGGVERSDAAAGTIVASLWLAGLLAMVGLSVMDRVRLRRVIAASAPAGDAVEEHYARVASSFRRGRRPRVLVTPRLESPALAGTFRPVILIPAWMTAPEHGERLEWALRHELTHWASRDHLANFVAEASRALFFFHPLAWWARRRWREAMEMACDESVVSNHRDIKRYAEQLYHILAHVDERRRLAPAASLFATRTQIGRRIETLLRAQRHVARPGAIAVAMVCTFAAASFTFGADFSPPRPPQAPEAPTASAVVVPATATVTPVAPAIASDVTVVGSRTVHYDNVNVYETDDERDLRLRAEGIEFERGTGRVIRLDDDGYLRVWEKAGTVERRVFVTADGDGGLRYNYRVDGERAEWDAEAQRWLARVLQTHLTRVRNHNRLIMAPPAAPAPGPTPTPAPALASEPAPAAVPEPEAEPAPESPPAAPKRPAKKSR